MTLIPLGELPELPIEAKAAMAELVARAQEHRANGRSKRAVALLRRTANRLGVPHVAAGFHALADLAAAHPERALTP
jgi:hypothetical protein